MRLHENLELRFEGDSGCFITLVDLLFDPLEYFTITRGKHQEQFVGSSLNVGIGIAQTFDSPLDNLRITGVRIFVGNDKMLNQP